MSHTHSYHLAPCPRILLAGKIPGGSASRSVADVLQSFELAPLAPHRPTLSARFLAKAIADGGQAAIDSFLSRGILRRSEWSRPDAVYTPGHGITVVYANRRLGFVRD